MKLPDWIESHTIYRPTRPGSKNPVAAVLRVDGHTWATGYGETEREAFGRMLSNLAGECYTISFGVWKADHRRPEQNP